METDKLTLRLNFHLGTVPTYRCVFNVNSLFLNELDFIPLATNDRCSTSPQTCQVVRLVVVIFNYFVYLTDLSM